jgi:hypothetical protein
MGALLAHGKNDVSRARPRISCINSGELA